MKTWIIATLSLLFSATSAYARDYWISAYSHGEDHVMELGSEAPIIVLSHRNFVAFGESPSRLAVSTIDLDAAKHLLHLIDRKTRRMVASWPIPMAPVSPLIDAKPNIVLTREHAYLLTLARKDPRGPMPTGLAGEFSVVGIDLRSGEPRVYPISASLRNPHLNDYQGVPLLTEWSSYSAWRLAADGSDFVEVIGEQDVADILAPELAETRRPTLPINARAEYVAVPGAGIFRLSRFGILNQVATPDLQALRPPRAALDLGPAFKKEMLFAALSEKGPAIGMIRRVQNQRVVTFVDPKTRHVSWERELPTGISLWTITSAGPDAVVYINPETRKLMTTDRNGTRVVRDLPEGAQYRGSIMISAGKP